MRINLVSPATPTVAPEKTLDLRLNRTADGTITLEARVNPQSQGNSTFWEPILTFPLGKYDGLLRLRRETNLPSFLSDFINTGGGSDSILMIRTDDRD